MQIKNWAWDRIWQSFGLLKKNFFKLVLPIFVYNAISFVFIWSTLLAVVFWVFDRNNVEWMDVFELLANPLIILFMSFGTVLFLIYLLLYVPVILWLIRWIKQSVDWTKVEPLKNLKFGVSRLLPSFKTYWYIFAYVALIPAIIFIIWWVILITWLFASINALVSLWVLVISGSSFLFLIFVIYRWVKSLFALYSATNDDDFTKSNFDNSVKITDNNWLRIIWNFILVWIVVRIFSYIIGIFLTLLPFSSFWIQSFLDPEVLNSDFLSKIIDDFSVTSHTVSSFLLTILNTIKSVFMSIFIYLLYIVLRWDTSWKNNGHGESHFENQIIDKEL